MVQILRVQMILSSPQTWVQMILSSPQTCWILVRAAARASGVSSYLLTGESMLCSDALHTSTACGFIGSEWAGFWTHCFSSSMNRRTTLRTWHMTPAVCRRGLGLEGKRWRLRRLRYITLHYISLYVWPWSTKPVTRGICFKSRCMHHLKTEYIIFPLMYGLDNIWKSEHAKNLNSEKIIFKVVQMKFLAMHNIKFWYIYGSKVTCNMISNDFWQNRNINNFDS